MLTFGEGAHLKELEHAEAPKMWKPTITQQGVVDLQPEHVWGKRGYPKELFTKLSLGLHALKNNDLPIWFIACSKEAQLLMRLIADYVKRAINKPGYEYVGDYGIFHINSDSKGWVPHRDNDSVRGALDSDGFPAYITAWMPLTPATTKSSCMYYIPRMHDPSYETGEAGEDYFSKVFDDPSDYQHILSLPMIPGGLVCHSARTIHWGSKPLPPLKGRKPEYESRQAISVGVARTKFQGIPLVREGAMEYPTFLESVVFALSHALRYNHQSPVHAPHLKCFKKIVKHNIDMFGEEGQSTLEDALS